MKLIFYFFMYNAQFHIILIHKTEIKVIHHRPKNQESFRGSLDETYAMYTHSAKFVAVYY